MLVVAEPVVDVPAAGVSAFGVGVEAGVGVEPAVEVGAEGVALLSLPVTLVFAPCVLVCEL